MLPSTEGSPGHILLSLPCHQGANHQKATHTIDYELRLYNRHLLGLHIRHSGHLEKEECERYSHMDLGLTPEDSSIGCVA